MAASAGIMGRVSPVSHATKLMHFHVLCRHTATLIPGMKSWLMTPALLHQDRECIGQQGRGSSWDHLLEDQAGLPVAFPCQNPFSMKTFLLLAGL